MIMIANSPMQNLLLPVYFILPRGVIGLFPVSCRLLVCDGMISCLVSSGICTFDQKVIGVIVRNKQGPHSRAVVRIRHFVKEFVIQVQVLLFEIIVEGHHDDLRSFFRRQTPWRLTIVTAATVWWETLLRITGLSGLKLRTNSTDDQEKQPDENWTGHCSETMYSTGLFNGVLARCTTFFSSNTIAHKFEDFRLPVRGLTNLAACFPGKEVFLLNRKSPLPCPFNWHCVTICRMHATQYNV